MEPIRPEFFFDFQRVLCPLADVLVCLSLVFSGLLKGFFEGLRCGDNVILEDQCVRSACHA